MLSRTSIAASPACLRMCWVQNTIWCYSACVSLDPELDLSWTWVLKFLYLQTLMEVYDKLVKCDECLPVAANEASLTHNALAAKAATLTSDPTGLSALAQR